MLSGGQSDRQPGPRYRRDSDEGAAGCRPLIRSRPAPSSFAALSVRAVMRRRRRWGRTGWRAGGGVRDGCASSDEGARQGQGHQRLSNA